MSWFSEWLHRLFPPRPTPGPPPVPPVPLPGDAAARLLAEHNRLRAANGLPAYRASPALDATAQRHADYMAARNELTHSEPGADPFQRIRTAGYPEGSENIAWNYRSPEDATRGWTGDRGHRANVLSARWTDAGFGVAYGRNGDPYWCADYGARP
jgi:uncharacterized protein YkwD